MTKEESHAALRAAHGAELAAVTQLAAEVDARSAVLDARNGMVSTLEDRRPGVLASGKREEVLALDEELRLARVDAQMAAEAYKRSTEAHAAGVVKAADAKKAVDASAMALGIARATDVAERFLVAITVAMALGMELESLTRRSGLNRPINTPAPVFPAVVLEALDRIPPRDPRNIPIPELRYGIPDAWSQLISELTAVDPPAAA